MRKRDPNHTARQALLQSQPKAEWLRQVAITNYKDPDYVASEVLAALIRVRFGNDNGQLDSAVNALNRRIVSLSRKHIYTHPVWASLAANNSELVIDAIQYLWGKLLSDTQEISNSEVRFAIFLSNRVDDFMRHQLTYDNSMPSSNDSDTSNEDDESIKLIDTLVDPECETPEEYAIRVERKERVLKMMMGLPKLERNAFYYRKELEYDWPKVAELLGCSIPTAHKHYKSCVDKLKGEL